MLFFRFNWISIYAKLFWVSIFVLFTKKGWWHWPLISDIRPRKSLGMKLVLNSFTGWMSKTVSRCFLRRKTTFFSFFFLCPKSKKVFSKKNSKAGWPAQKNGVFLLFTFSYICLEQTGVLSIFLWFIYRVYFLIGYTIFHPNS